MHGEVGPKTVRPSNPCNSNSNKHWERFPEGIIKTRFGDLIFDHGYPSHSTVTKLYREIDFQRACQAYLWAIPIVSLAQYKHTLAITFGAGEWDLFRQIDYQSKIGSLTAKANTTYFSLFTNLSITGPLVVEIPEGAIAGLVDDCWQRPLIVYGMFGPDQGRGGKYLFLGPGMTIMPDDSYVIVRSPTNTIMQSIRILATDAGEANMLLDRFKVYPYTQRYKPPKIKIIDTGNRTWFAMPPRGLDYWERLHSIIQIEPIEERDRFFLSMLRPLGIAKGKLFQPNEQQQDILTEAALIGEAMARVNDFHKRFEGVTVWENRRWVNLVCFDPTRRQENFDQLDERAAFYYEAIGSSAGMTTKMLGYPLVYLAVYKDCHGNWLEGGQGYRLRVPRNVPARQCWSFTVYDNDTRALIDNYTHKADLSSRQELAVNPDGSIELYFGPDLPQGNQKNWVQTLPDKGWFTHFCLQAPTEAYFDSSWKLPDIEPVVFD